MPHASVGRPFGERDLADQPGFHPVCAAGIPGAAPACRMGLCPEPDAARSSKTIATARSRCSAGCCFRDTMGSNFPRDHSLQETRGGPLTRFPVNPVPDHGRRRRPFRRRKTKPTSGSVFPCCAPDPLVTGQRPHRHEASAARRGGRADAADAGRRGQAPGRSRVRTPGSTAVRRESQAVDQGALTSPGRACQREGIHVGGRPRPTGGSGRNRSGAVAAVASPLPDGGCERGRAAGPLIGKPRRAARHPRTAASHLDWRTCPC